MFKILVLNLGATSTKVALFQDEQCIDERVIRHTPEELAKCTTSEQQLEYRNRLVLSWLAENNEKMDDISAVTIRGAKMPRRICGGTFEVKGAYAEDLLRLYEPDKPLIHGARITLPLARRLIGDREIPIFVTDPPCTNELTEVAEISGNALYKRDVIFHALNQKEAARRTCAELGVEYTKARLIVAHMGGGVSVGAHDCGRVVDVNNCVQGEGPFSPERCGKINAVKIIDACFSGRYTHQEMISQIQGNGGVKSYLGTADMREVEERALAGDQQAELIFHAMAYNIGKEIGAMYAVLHGQVNAIVLTGGIAHSRRMTDLIKSMVSGFAPVKEYPGEFESEALVNGVLRILRGEESLQNYG